jgi:hypothetical protein
MRFWGQMYEYLFNLQENNAFFPYAGLDPNPHPGLDPGSPRLRLVGIQFFVIFVN